MKPYIIYVLFFGYLSAVVFGRPGHLFTSAKNLEESNSNATKLEESSSKATNLEELFNNVTNLEESSSNATDLNNPTWNFFPYVIQNGTETKLEHEFKGAIKVGGGKGGGNKGKVTGGNKGKVTGGNKGKITGGNRGGYRYRKTRKDGSSGGTTTDSVYVYIGIFGGCILIAIVVGYITYFMKSKKNNEEN